MGTEYDFHRSTYDRQPGGCGEVTLSEPDANLEPDVQDSDAMIDAPLPECDAGWALVYVNAWTITAPADAEGDLNNFAAIQNTGRERLSFGPTMAISSRDGIIGFFHGQDTTSDGREIPVGYAAGLLDASVLPYTSDYVDGIVPVLDIAKLTFLMPSEKSVGYVTFRFTGDGLPGSVSGQVTISAMPHETLTIQATSAEKTCATLEL